MSQQKKHLVDNSKDDEDMSCQDDNEAGTHDVSKEDDSEMNFLEEASRCIHHNLEALNALIHESHSEIPVAAEIVQSNCFQMNDIKISLATKTAELGNLAEHLKFYYKESSHVVEDVLRSAGDERSVEMDGP